MSKWISPTEQKRRQVAAEIARVRPAAAAAVADLVRGWGDDPLPTGTDGWSNLIIRACRRVVADAQVTPDSIANEVAIELSNDLHRPIAARAARERIAAQKAAEALVDTDRPLVATVAGDERIGACVIVSEYDADLHQHVQRVLVCIGRSSRPRDDDMDEAGGWYSDLAEPTEAERQSADFQRCQAKVDADREHEERQMRLIADRRQRELDAIREQGREPSDLEDLFAGTSDN